jgi:tRNA(adenine34) deaminase
MACNFNSDFMVTALNLAKIALSRGDIPVGAVIVDHKKTIIGKGYNSSNIVHDPTLHAEIIAIRDACINIGSKLLTNCAIYVTVEPCLMCATAISYAQLSQLYYGCSNYKFGAVESNIYLYQSKLALHAPEVYSGIKSGESMQLLKDYFLSKR